MVPGNKICALRNVVDEVLRFSLHPIFILLNKQYSGKVSNLVVVPKAPSTRIRIEDFENAAFSFTCGRTKTDVFEYIACVAAGPTEGLERL